MLGGIHTDLLVAVTFLFLTHAGTQCRAEHDFSLVTLPDWRTNSEYVTQCFYDRHKNLICDWTRNQSFVSAAGTEEDVAVNMLESGPLGMEGEACLEFWYLTSVAAKASDLHVLLKSSVGLVEIWTSPALPRDSWRQVFVPLTITEPGTQVVFKASSAVSMEGQVLFNQIGVRKGSCGQQCESNTELWTDESTRCLCSAGQLSCSPSQCPQGQICSRQNESSSGNSASGTCTIHSNRDCSTFDGALFRFMSSCTYTLAKTCSPTETLPMFSVAVVSEERGNLSLPNVQQVIVEMGNFRVSLLKKQTHRVVVNGIWRKLPLRLSNSTVNIKSNPAAVTLETTLGLSVSYDAAGAVHVILPSTYSDHVCGLCGNFNYLRGDDFRKPDGTDAQDATALAESWQTGQTTSSCETILVPHQCDPLEEAEYASELYCGGILSSTGPFADCLSALGAESYFRSCVVGMCSTHGDLAVLCETFHDYADICREAGIAIPIWRNSTFCPHQCGENSHYNSCADGCPEVCSSLDIAGPCGSCVETCECDAGFKLSGGKCVPAEDCGCWHHGNHYDRGETWLQGECVLKCQCVGENVTQCTKMQCADNEICKVKDGIKGCYLLNAATCSVYGDPHYITFDGMAYDFQGGCSYTLATTCVEESLVQFTVVGHNIHPPLQNFTRSKLEAVTLQVEDLHLTLNDSREVNVNNVQVQLPYSTKGAYGSVQVYMKNNFIVLETTFGLRMMIDGQNRLFLQVDERYKYELCGLCGTYSDQQDDDFITSGGQNVTEPFEFGDSWRVPDDYECVAHPNDPRLCDYEEENNAYNECYTLLKDAFKSCHEVIHPSIYINSCVHDYCATNGDQHTLCESLKSYATACQVAGVELPHWQTDTACAEPPTTAIPPTTPTPASPTPDQTFCPMNCNFEENLCGWKQLIQDSFDWTRNSGSTPSNLTGPNQDHTTGAGFYMYIEGNSATHGDSARLQSSVCHHNGPLCLHFWYHMYGSATAMVLNIYLLKDNKATKLWSMMNDQGPKWHPVYLDISVFGPFQIIIEGIRGSEAESDVAIDDIYIHFGSCTGNFPGPVSGTELSPTTVEILPSYPVCNIDCSFDSNLCSWNQMTTDAFDWTWQSGSTPSLMTGPSADHTGDGHYLYIEANRATHGDTARLISSECSDSGPQCLQFWYHMYGSADTMGLNVYLLQGRNAYTVWRKRNDQGNMWHLAQLDFTTTGAFQIIIEGRRGSNEESDVAIDDVKLYHGRCSDLSDVVTNPPKPDGDTTAPPSVTVPTTAAQETPLVNVTHQLPVTPQPPVANVTIPSAVETTTPLLNKNNVTEAPANRSLPHSVCQLHCDFEQDLCQWNQLLTDVFDWTRHSGSTPTMMTGPSSDHTTGDGHYLYIEANRATHGDTARLISSECSDSGPQCLQFWYHMYGSADTMGLNVYLLQGRNAYTVWRKRNDQGNMWHLAQLDFTTTGAFQIIFEGRRGSNDQSDVAIDDVSLHRGHCTDPGKPTNPAPTTFNPATTKGPELPPEISSTQPQTSASSETHPTSTFTTTETSKTSNPDLLTTRLELPLTSRPILTATIRPETTARLQPSTIEHVGVETSAPSEPEITERPRTTATPEQPATSTNEPQQTMTSKPQSPATNQPQLPTTAVSQKTTNTHSVCQLHCDFEQDLCQWNQLLTDVFDWTRHSGSTPTMMTGPSSDHTNGDGHYLYIEANRATHGDTARLISSECSDSGPQCLQFWYHMYGSADTMGLNVYLLQGRNVYTVWRKTNDQGNMWHLAQLDFTTTGAFQIIFEGRRGSNDQSDVAIDDVSLHRGHCTDPGKPTNPAPTTFNPATTKGPELPPEISSTQPQTSASSETHPPSTFTTTETSKTSNPDLLTTRLELTITSRPILTATIRPETTARLQPSTIEHVGVETSAPSEPEITERPRTTATPEQPATSTDQPQQTMTSKPQPPSTNQPQLPTTAVSQKTTNTHSVCQLHCDFEQDLCQWNQLLTDVFDWTRHSGSTPTMMTGPSSDHTTGDGHYLYIEANRATHGDTARLISSECSDSGPQCLQFWYHMYGSADTMGLNVYMLQGRNVYTVWRKRNDQGNMWHLAQLDFTTTGAFQIIIEGRRGSNEESDVAIDDVKLYHGRCSDLSDVVTNPPKPDGDTTAPTTFNPATTKGPELPPEISSTQPQTSANTHSQTTVTPQPSTTARPQPSTTARPQPPTEAQPQPQTTVNPQPPTTSQMASQTTSRPTPLTTTTPKPPLTTRPQPSSTLKPQPTTAEPQSTTTLRTQPTTTIKPHSTTGRPQSTTTAIPQSPTTARPRPTATIKPYPTTVTYQPTSTKSTTTESPQPSTTSAPTPSCPQNSHYTTCIPACSPTCAYLNGPPGCSDNKSCIQGCVCDAGFVQKGRVCVPIQQCGCVDRNGTIHQFDEVWYINHCSQKCECEKHHGVGKIDCDNKEECDGNAICLQNEEGDYYCQPTDFNECIIKKDNEYRTFDKMRYDFEGEHSYVLVQTKNLPNNLQDVYIEGINTRILHDDEDSQQHGDSSSEEDHSRSVMDEDEDDDDEEDDDDDKHDDSEENEEHQILQELKIRVYNHTVELKKKRRLVVDGKRTNTPIAPTAGLNIYEHFSRIYLKTDFGLSVEFDGQSTAEIILPRIYRRKVGGLCGNFDGQKRNDWMKPDGTRARSAEEFEESWRV